MTFSEFLEKQDMARMMKLGSLDGSGFYYCGTVGDILSRMETYNRILYGREVHLISRCIERINQMEAAGPMSVDPNIVGQWRHEVERRKNRLEWLWHNHAHYISLADREVVEHYDATGYDEGAVIVILEGYENGAYWTLDEVKEPMSFARGGAGTDKQVPRKESA